MEKKAIQYKIVNDIVNSSTSMIYEGRINKMLDDGWDILSSFCYGLDTAGGVSGAGSMMIYTAMVKYGYYDVPANDAVSDLEADKSVDA